MDRVVDSYNGKLLNIRNKLLYTISIPENIIKWKIPDAKSHDNGWFCLNQIPKISKYIATEK